MFHLINIKEIQINKEISHFTHHIDKHWKKKNYWKLILDTYTEVNYKIICIGKRKVKEEKTGGGEAGQVADWIQQVRVCWCSRSYAEMKKNIWTIDSLRIIERNQFVENFTI